MATLRMKVRDQKRKKLSDSKKASRTTLRELIKNPGLEYDDKIKAILELNKKPRDESCCRVRNRCSICGRSRSVYRRFKLCRLCLRKAFTFGLVPGLRKSSW